MASTYGNDLRLEEIGDGEQSGTWGATTNTNLELIAEALSFGTEAITTNADTHTTTIADGATDPGRSLYLKYTGTLDSTCTITIAPNSISKTWYIENGTTGSQSIIISQGSGANVTIPTGQTKVVYSDGAGSGAAMAEIGTLGVTNLAVTTNATVGGTLGVTGVLTGTSLDISGNVDIDGTLETDALSINSTAVTSTAAELNILDGVTATTAELNIMDGVTSTTAELNILDGVTSTAAELNQLDAITRGSILYGNASGATARLAKGSAATVLTSDGTDISWAEAGGGGGEQTFTATGAISAGDVVGFNSNGTISVVEAELQASVAQGSGAAKFQALVYDTANDKVLLFFQGTSYYLYGRVGTIANGQISFGTVVTTSVGADDIHAAYDVNSGKTVVTYTQKNGNNYPYAVVVTVSGTDLSFGTPVVMKSSAQYNTIVEYDSNAQKVLCIYNANNGKVYGRVGTVSGTSISFGTEAEVSTLNATIDGTALSFDSTANKFVLSMIGYGAGVPTLRVLTISGTSVSGGTAVNGNGLSNATYRPELTYIPSINRTVLIQGYAGAYAYYYILTVSGTDITVPSGVRYDATVAIGPGQTYVVVAGDKMYMQYPESAGSKNTLLQIDVSTTQITFSPLSSKIQWGDGSSSEYPVAVYDPDTGSLVNADGTNVRILNATAPAFVGIAAENISNGATGTVTVVGGINTSVSGLTAGKSYAITPSSASLSVAQLPSSSGVIGIALSSSSIYLNVGKI